ncbi:MAG: hypothetical protein WC655_26350, partial [Candidatus Hydrogenedentales bacterium]
MNIVARVFGRTLKELVCIPWKLSRFMIRRCLWFVFITWRAFRDSLLGFAALFIFVFIIRYAVVGPIWMVTEWMNGVTNIPILALIWTGLLFLGIVVVVIRETMAVHPKYIRLAKEKKERAEQQR